MKSFLILALFVATINFACKKQAAHNCVSSVIITNSAPPCGAWGIVVNGVKYPSSNIPAAFQQPGIFVCAEYELYEDLRLCPCCGGTWANIKSMTYQGD